MSESNDGGKERRYAAREKLNPIEIRGFTSLDHMTLLSRSGAIVDASKSGFLLHIDRKALVPQQFRDQLSLAALEGDRVFLMIDLLNLEITGTIKRTKRLTKDLFEVVVDFSDDSPEYWREMLLELLPREHDWE